MSGRRQHYLPRFLQRAFRFRGEGDSALVYAHERDKVYSPNVMGLGQERDFYGHPEESGLDAAITATEDRLAAIHRQFLAVQDVGVSAADAASLISAVSIRTKSMREAMNALGPMLITVLEAHFKDDETLRAVFRREGANPRLFDDAMNKQREALAQLDRNKRAVFRARARQEYERLRVEREPEAIVEMKRHAAELISYLRGRAAQMADAGFLKALNSDPAMTKRTEKFSLFSYSVSKTEVGRFYILGDCGVVGLFSDGSARLALGDIDDDATVDAVLLPISPELCLVGRRTDGVVDVSPRFLNRHSASLSHRFFVSNRNDESELAELRELIGTVAPIATEEKLLGLMRGSGVSGEDE